MKLSRLLLASALLSTPALAQRMMPQPIPVDPKIVALQQTAMADKTAWTILEGITTEVGPRPDGSDKETLARSWAVARLKALGFANVHVEPYQVPTWQRGVETAEVTSPFPQPLHLTALGNSGATPSAGLALPVVFFPTLNDLMLAPDMAVRGKIVFVSNVMLPTLDGSSYGSQGIARFLGPNVAAQKGAAAIVIRSIGTDHGRGPHAGVTNFAPGVTPIPAAALSVSDAANLERMFQRGQPITLHLTLTPKNLGPRPSGNVVAEVPGTDPAAGIILIGGHLDSWDLGTGAIDDGAGIAITAAAAKLVRDMGAHRRTIRVVWFGDEETGGFGGEAYAKAHAADHHVLASESDFGADRVWRFSAKLPPEARPIADRWAAAFNLIGVGRTNDPAHGGTDVEPTLAQGVAGVDLGQNGLRYFDYHHTPEDTLEIVDPAQLAQNVAAWATMLAIAADAPETISPVSAAK